jgi:hypothetical protein
VAVSPSTALAASIASILSPPVHPLWRQGCQVVLSQRMNVATAGTPLPRRESRVPPLRPWSKHERMQLIDRVTAHFLAVLLGARCAVRRGQLRSYCLLRANTCNAVGCKVQDARRVEVALVVWGPRSGPRVSSTFEAPAPRCRGQEWDLEFGGGVTLQKGSPGEILHCPASRAPSEIQVAR